MVHWTRSGGNLCCLANRFSWKPQIINIQLSTIFFPNTLRNLRGRGGQWSEKFPRIGGGRDAPPSLPLLLQVLLKTLLSHNWPDATRCLTFDSNPNTFKIKYENFTKVPGGKMGENGFVARRRERPGGEKRFEGCQDWPRPARKKVPGPLIVLAWLRWTYAGRQNTRLFMQRIWIEWSEILLLIVRNGGNCHKCEQERVSQAAGWKWNQ